MIDTQFAPVRVFNVNKCVTIVDSNKPADRIACRLTRWETRGYFSCTIYPAGKGWAANITHVFDPALAESLLAEVGAVKEGGTWMLDGAPLEIDIVTYTSRAALAPTAELTQAFLQAIGVKANVRAGEYGASNDAIKDGSADMFLQAWVTTPQGDPGAVLEALLKSTGGSNAGGYNKAELDNLLADGRTTLMWQRARKFTTACNR